MFPSFFTLGLSILYCLLISKKSSPSGTKYDESEVLATAQALSIYREEADIGEKDYKVTITIDGLSKTMAVRFGSDFRKLGIRSRKTIGMRDESNAIIRLADAVAGLVRESHEGRPEYVALERKMKKQHKLQDL